MLKKRLLLFNPKTITKDQFDIFYLLKACGFQIYPEFIVGPYNVDFFIPNFYSHQIDLDKLEENYKATKNTAYDV